MYTREETFKLARNALIEALRNGESEPLSADYKMLWLMLKVLVKELCIEEPRSWNFPYSDKSYYFDPGDFLSIRETEDHKFVIHSTYKERLQELKHTLDKKLQEIEQEYDKLYPIEGWNSEYDEFLD